MKVHIYMQHVIETSQSSEKSFFIRLDDLITSKMYISTYIGAVKVGLCCVDISWTHFGLDVMASWDSSGYAMAALFFISCP